MRGVAAFLVLVVGAGCGTRLDITATAGAPEAGLAAPDAGGFEVDPDVPAEASGEAGAPARSRPATRTSGGSGAGGAASAVTANAGNGGATDVGVSATEIRVGNASTITGPIPGQFRPMPEAVRAYFAKVNASGGVAGRRLTLIGCDDELNGQKRLACLKHLVEDQKVFAFVGNLSAADENDAGYLDTELKGAVPDVGGFALSYSRSATSGYWSPMGGLKRELATTAHWEFLRARTGFARPMVFWHNITISREQGQTVQYELSRVLGVDPGTIPTRETTVVQTDYNSDVLQARRNGIDAIFSSMEIASNIRLLRAIAAYRDATWNPVVHFELSTYSPELLRSAGADAEGLYIRIPHVPFSEPGFPPMADYLSTLKRYFPASQPASFGLFGWVGARFFVEAMRRAGPQVTRAKLAGVFETFRGAAPYTADDLIGPNTDIRARPFSCQVITQVSDEARRLDFRRVSGPGFVCSTHVRWRDPYRPA